MEAATKTALPAVNGPPRRHLPPGSSLPRAVQTAIWARKARWGSYAWQDRYGDIFTLRLIHEGTWVMLGDPGVVKEVFSGDPRVFHAGEGNRILVPMLGPNSLLVLDEDVHMSQRKLLLPALHGKRMMAHEEMMRELASREIESWPTGIPYELRPRMQVLTLEIILRAVFGMQEGERMTELRDALRDFLKLTTDPRQLLPMLLLGPDRIPRIPWFRRIMKRIDFLLRREIAERRRASDLADRDDILSMLVTARHEDDSPMGDTEIRDQLLTLLAAGHETTATSLAWAVERLSRHPQKLERLRDGVEAGSDDYLTATIQETLRLRPVLAIVLRRLTEPVEIGGYELPAGIAVVPNIYLVHRNPEVYPEPDRFLPERFLDNPPGTYTWIPFGGGIRRCIGGTLSQFEMAVILRELVELREIRPANPKPERIFRRAITETPRHNAEVILS
jgi:cytochrome P450 family 135